MSGVEGERNHGEQLYKGPVKVQHLPDVRGFSEAKLQKHNLFTTERFFLDVYCLRPGQAQTPHAHPGSDKVYLVLEGTAHRGGRRRAPGTARGGCGVVSGGLLPRRAERRDRATPGCW